MLGGAAALLPSSFSKMQSLLPVTPLCFNQRAETNLSRTTTFLKITDINCGFSDQYSPPNRMF